MESLAGARIVFAQSHIHTPAMYYALAAASSCDILHSLQSWCVFMQWPYCGPRSTLSAISGEMTSLDFCLFLLNKNVS